LSILLPDLKRRSRQPEVMDQPGLPEPDHRRALDALATINWLSATSRVLWPPIRELARNQKKPLRVLDIATGGGDVPIQLWRLARKANVPLEIAGCDISRHALVHARQRAARAGAEINFFELDAIHDPIPAGYDALVSSLFLHHLDESDACSMLRRMSEATGQILLISDLLRSRLGYALAWFVTRFLTRSWVARIDGPLSIRGAYSHSEVAVLAESAGLQGASITRHWPERFLLHWSRPA